MELGHYSVGELINAILVFSVESPLENEYSTHTTCDFLVSIDSPQWVYVGQDSSLLLISW